MRGLADNGIRACDWLHESVGMVRMFAPLWNVALVQWLNLHIYLSRQTRCASRPHMIREHPASTRTPLTNRMSKGACHG